MGNENTIALRLALTGATQVQAGLKAVAATLGALVATNLSVGNLVRLTNQAIKTADEIGKLAQKSGIVVESLSSLSFAAKLNDLEQSELQLAFKELSKTMVEQGRETENLEDRMLQLADVFASMPDGPQKAKLALDNFGRSGIQLIPFLNQGSEAIRKQRMEAEQFGLVISSRFAGNADQFNDNLFRIKSSFQGIFLQVAERLLPTLIELQEQFIEFKKNIENREAIVSGLVELFKRAAMFGAGLAQAFEQVSIFAMRMANAIQGNVVPWQQFQQQSADSWKNFTRLIESLDKIGEQTEENAEAQKSANAPMREYVQLATKLASLKSIMSVEKGGLDWITGGSSGLKGSARRQEMIRSLETQIRLSKQIESELTKTAPKTSAQIQDGVLLKTEKQIEFENQLLGIQRQRYQLETQLREVNSQENFSDRLRSNIETMQESFGTVATNIADIITGTIGTAVNSISQQFTQLILGTQSWGQTLRNIGLNVVTELIQSIIRMGVQFVLQHVIMRGAMVLTNALGIALGGKSTQATIAQENAKAPGLAANAASASIASYGSAAVIGGIAAVAALGLVLAASLGSFAAGGYTGAGGRYDIAGVAHKGEYIFTAPEVNSIGIPAIEAFKSGRGTSSVSSTRSEGPRITNIIATDETHIRQLLRSRAGVEEILNIVRMGKVQLGLS